MKVLSWQAIASFCFLLKVNKVVKEELISLIKRDLSYRRFNKIALTNRTMIYKTCAIIFDKVVEGILGGDMIETK